MRIWSREIKTSLGSAFNSNVLSVYRLQEERDCSRAGEESPKLKKKILKQILAKKVVTLKMRVDNLNMVA